MVENAGKTLRADTYKPVNTPEPVNIEENASGGPLAAPVTIATLPLTRSILISFNRIY